MPRRKTKMLQEKNALQRKNQFNKTGNIDVLPYMHVFCFAFSNFLLLRNIDRSPPYIQEKLLCTLFKTPIHFHPGKYMDYSYFDADNNYIQLVDEVK